MKFFSKQDSLVIASILLVIFVVSFFNFRISLRRSRDAQRKADFGSIADALNRFSDDFGFYPPSSPDARIVACIKTNFDLEPCDWGLDALVDPSDPTYPPYLEKLPIDPESSKGVSYRYISNGSRFQIMASLEGKDEDEYQESIEARGVSCGTRVCNSGKGSGRTPLDKSLQEYENE